MTAPPDEDDATTVPLDQRELQQLVETTGMRPQRPTLEIANDKLDQLRTECRPELLEEIGAELVEDEGDGIPTTVDQ